MAQNGAAESGATAEAVASIAQRDAAIKKEVEVKPEPVECVVCANRTKDTFDMFATNTKAGHSMHQFLCRVTQVDVRAADNCSKALCKSCVDLINVLEQAEMEYLKLKENFEAIISKNPLFEQHGGHGPIVRLDTVKNELPNIYEDTCDNVNDDSEDEPLAVTRKKRHRKTDKTKKKSTVQSKRKVRSKPNKDSWECGECDERGDEGGLLAEAAHKLAAHGGADTALALRDVIKKEDSTDGSQSPHSYEFKVELEEDDDSSTYEPDTSKEHKKRKLLAPKARRKRGGKVSLPCDQCHSKFSTLQRLEQHKTKHEVSKPPYICEVCGAHYKHKRACDIHVALHKGISDWKCEECNKLFPSKGALQRHNNIHTGKLNYQCDLCGKSFIHTSSFKMHKLSHSGLKPHACDVCGLALMTRSHLKRHKRVHSGEKRHECAVCGKRFSERYNLAAHSKSHEAAGAPAAGARRRLFRCHFCPERFERRYMLERHMPLAHGRALERPPPTPRNTMSKLLKAQAQARAAAAPRTDADNKTKEDASPAPATPPLDAPKLFAHLTNSSSSSAPTTWSGAYVAEFGLRHDYH